MAPSSVNERVEPTRLRAIRGGASGSHPKPQSSDEELIAGIVQGDDRIALELYHRLLPVVERSLLRVFGRRETDHEDLVQTSFEQIVMTLSKQRYAGACSLKTWASTIAGNVALKALRSRIRRRKVLAPTLEPEAIEERHSLAPNAEQSASMRQDLERVRAELAQLAQPKAEALLLHDVLGHGPGPEHLLRRGVDECLLRECRPVVGGGVHVLSPSCVGWSSIR